MPLYWAWSRFPSPCFRGPRWIRLTSVWLSATVPRSPKPSAVLFKTQDSKTTKTQTTHMRQMFSRSSSVPSRRSGHYHAVVASGMSCCLPTRNSVLGRPRGQLKCRCGIVMMSSGLRLCVGFALHAAFSFHVAGSESVRSGSFRGNGLSKRASQVNASWGFSVIPSWEVWALSLEHAQPCCKSFLGNGTASQGDGVRQQALKKAKPCYLESLQCSHLPFCRWM